MRPEFRAFVPHSCFPVDVIEITDELFRWVKPFVCVEIPFLVCGIPYMGLCPASITKGIKSKVLCLCVLRGCGMEDPGDAQCQQSLLDALHAFILVLSCFIVALLFNLRMLLFPGACPLSALGFFAYGTD